jgi:hypothetical protein
MAPELSVEDVEQVRRRMETTGTESIELFLHVSCQLDVLPEPGGNSYEIISQAAEAARRGGLQWVRAQAGARHGPSARD